jgi:hypothetical protein
VDGNAAGAVRGVGTPDDYTMGDYALAVGSGTVASGYASFAGGIRPQATGSASHAEGYDTVSSALASHAEGNASTATAEAAHAEGGSHASGLFSHAEGLQSEATGESSHAEGLRTRAQADNSHAEGYVTAASGYASHAEGFSCVTSNFAAHAEGNRCTATGIAAHAEGLDSLATGPACHAEGAFTQATGEACHAEGIVTISAGLFNHAEGALTKASGYVSHAGGLFTATADFDGAHIIGRFGAADAAYSWFLANGTDELDPGLSAKILGTGDAYIDNAWHGGGADYAELYETESGLPIEPGCFVTFAGATEKVREAQGGDDFILGVTSAAPGFVAGAGELRWKKKFLTDEWGRVQRGEVSVPDLVDKAGKVIIPAHTESRPMQNPEFDPGRQYVPREQRPEWVKVALLGLVPVRDDGSAVPGGHCRPGADGVATAAEAGYRVVKRTGANQVLILFR